MRTKFVDGSEADDYAYSLFTLAPHDRIPGALRETPIQDFDDDDVHLEVAKRQYAELERQHLTPGHQPKNLPPLKFPGLKIPEVAAYRYVRLVARSEVSGGAWTTVADFQVLAEGRPLDRSAWKVGRRPGPQLPGAECNGPDAGVVLAHAVQERRRAQAPALAERRPAETVQDQRLSLPAAAGHGRRSDRRLRVPGQQRRRELDHALLRPLPEHHRGADCQRARAEQAPGSVPGLPVRPADRHVRGRRQPWTAVEDFQLLLDGNPIDRTDWGVTVDSFETDGEFAPAQLAIDGQPGTYWHSQWQKQAPRHPHWLSVDMQTQRTINGFRYQPRTGSVNGRIADYELQVSNDGQNWTTVNTGRFSGTAEAQTMNFKLPRVV